MKKILVTGATGNIGIEVIKFLFSKSNPNEIIAGVRNIDKAKNTFKDFGDLKYVHFDFEEQKSFDAALKDIDTVFLLRPPHISNIKKYFNPLIEKLKENSILEIVFLSVQGAEKSKVIPHNKIERLIKESGINYIFLRPSYFMQNLTTTLLSDIKSKREIILPAGEAKFNWIDIENIGEVCACLLDGFERYNNQAIELTGNENESFSKVVEIINEIIPQPITYINTNPFKFYRLKKGDGMEKGMIVVMLMLHFLPRFQKEPQISDIYETWLNKKPTTLAEFIKREKEKFI